MGSKKNSREILFEYFLHLLSDDREAISSYDSRAATIVGVNGVLITIILATHDFITEISFFYTVLHIALIGISLCFLIASVFFAIFVFTPASLPRPDTFSTIEEGIERLQEYEKMLSHEISKKARKILWSYRLFLIGIVFLSFTFMFTLFLSLLHPSFANIIHTA